MTGTISWKSEFLSLSRRFAGRIAVVDRDGSITYRDLFAKPRASARRCEPRAPHRASPSARSCPTAAARWRRASA